MTVEGIDVSHWQGDIDWGKVKEAGKRFALIKATDGIGPDPDPAFAANRAGAHQAGLIVGLFHFARFGEDPAEQVDFFLRTVGKMENELPPMVDLEKLGLPGGADGPCSPDQIIPWIHDFAAGMHKQSGRHPILYTEEDFWGGCTGNTTEFSERRLWVASWSLTAKSPTMPGGWKTWTFWQYWDKGHVSGIGTADNPVNVDLDRFNGDEQALAALVNKAENSPDA